MLFMILCALGITSALVGLSLVLFAPKKGVRRTGPMILVPAALAPPCGVPVAATPVASPALVASIPATPVAWTDRPPPADPKVRRVPNFTGTPGARTARVASRVAKVAAKAAKAAADKLPAGSKVETRVTTETPPAASPKPKKAAKAPLCGASPKKSDLLAELEELSEKKEAAPKVGAKPTTTKKATKPAARKGKT